MVWIALSIILAIVGFGGLFVALGSTGRAR
jgi:hypothetical protein